MTYRLRRHGCQAVHLQPGRRIDALAAPGIFAGLLAFAARALAM